MGFAVICPHLNTALFSEDTAKSTVQYIAGDLEILNRLYPKIDVIVMLPKWRTSRGAKREHAHAVQRSLVVTNWPEDREWLRELADGY